MSAPTEEVMKLAQEMREHVNSRGGPARHGNDKSQPPVNPNGAWVMMLAAADHLAALSADRASCQAQVEELERALRGAETAIAEFYRYWTGGEMRGSYDGKPERDALWKAMHAARTVLARSALEGK